MRRLVAAGMGIVLTWWVGCSSDECSDTDKFGQKRKKTAEQEAECKAKENPTETPTDTTDGGSSNTDTTTGGGSTGGGGDSGGGGSGGGGSAPDTVPPAMVSFVRASPPQTNSVPVNFTVTFSEPLNVSSFVSADIVNAGTAAGVIWSVTNSGDAKTFTVSATASGNGSLQPRIVAAGIADVAGNTNAANIDATEPVSYLTGNVSVTLGQASGQPDPTSQMPIQFRIQFSRPINPASFTVADITQQGTATAVTWQLSSSDNIVWNLMATNALSSGTIMPFILANTVQDNHGNLNTSSSSSDGTVTYNKP